MGLSGLESGLEDGGRVGEARKTSWLAVRWSRPGGNAIALLGEIASMFLGAACRRRFGDVDGRVN